MNIITKAIFYIIMFLYYQKFDEVVFAKGEIDVRTTLEGWIENIKIENIERLESSHVNYDLYRVTGYCHTSELSILSRLSVASPKAYKIKQTEVKIAKSSNRRCYKK